MSEKRPDVPEWLDRVMANTATTCKVDEACRKRLAVAVSEHPDFQEMRVKAEAHDALASGLVAISTSDAGRTWIARRADADGLNVECWYGPLDLLSAIHNALRARAELAPEPDPEEA